MHSSIHSCPKPPNNAVNRDMGTGCGFNIKPGLVGVAICTMRVTPIQIQQHKSTWNSISKFLSSLFTIASMPFCSNGPISENFSWYGPSSPSSCSTSSSSSSPYSCCCLLCTSHTPTRWLGHKPVCQSGLILKDQRMHGLAGQSLLPVLISLLSAFCVVPFALTNTCSGRGPALSHLTTACGHMRSEVPLISGYVWPGKVITIGTCQVWRTPILLLSLRRFAGDLSSFSGEAGGGRLYIGSKGPEYRNGKPYLTLCQNHSPCISM
jgi:hypothetical protein